jgi:hypothetical protein
MGPWIINDDRFYSSRNFFSSLRDVIIGAEQGGVEGIPSEACLA